MCVFDQMLDGWVVGVIVLVLYFVFDQFWLVWMYDVVVLVVVDEEIVIVFEGQVGQDVLGFFFDGVIGVFGVVEMGQCMLGQIYIVVQLGIFVGQVGGFDGGMLLVCQFYCLVMYYQCDGCKGQVQWDDGEEDDFLVQFYVCDFI